MRSIHDNIMLSMTGVRNENILAIWIIEVSDLKGSVFRFQLWPAVANCLARNSEEVKRDMPDGLRIASLLWLLVHHWSQPPMPHVNMPGSG